MSEKLGISLGLRITTYGSTSGIQTWMEVENESREGKVSKFPLISNLSAFPTRATTVGHELLIGSSWAVFKKFDFLEKLPVRRLE
jgi:hypothetical protein